MKYLCVTILFKNIYQDKRLPPLDARVMALFDTAEENHHKCVMYNLYNSANFNKAEYNHEKKY